ncbi:hypothetical protein DXG03_000979 [Asterophora parasitica]|uniref:G domain-containing protein n=1 Tax=Asterophora parasitica TaxID=117018 RepID=A0A9P7G5E0_9AGAR|nr:hypothetical protein DXG03_000979 [Asterophora parasitica]
MSELDTSNSFATATPAASPTLSGVTAEEVRSGGFRVLIIGRANSGKTTILQKVCNTKDEPEIFDSHGNEIVQNDILDPTAKRGIHNIDHRISFKSNPGFIFHDSRGFESGSADEVTTVKDFIAHRIQQEEWRDNLHAIWYQIDILFVQNSSAHVRDRYCLPMDNARPITRAEEIFFNEIGTGRVPVILIFTKFDGFVKTRFADALQQAGSDWSQAPAMAQKQAISDFNKLRPELAIYKSKYPPKAYVCLQGRDPHS